ncbi:MAG TPA: hypothetical protein VGQ74_14235 [Methylomirabilota bacterium]|jgi:hypothetical protein|nr:hypothetical protein [Methylomirabilota bacterium]
MPCYSNLVIFDQLTRVGRVDRFARYPSVKNLILNQVTYNCCRHQRPGSTSSLRSAGCS